MSKTPLNIVELSGRLPSLDPTQHSLYPSSVDLCSAINICALLSFAACQKDFKEEVSAGIVAGLMGTVVTLLERVDEAIDEVTHG